MLHKKFNQEDLATQFFNKKWILVKEKINLNFKLFKNVKYGSAQKQSTTRVDSSYLLQSL